MEDGRPGVSGLAGAYNEPFGALAGFWSLPNELQQRIFTLACGPPVIPRCTIVGRSTDCATTMLSLLHAAKVFAPFIHPLLYRHVRLTRPSALHAFARTLCAKPTLGGFLETIHIGTDEELPLEWWPVREDDAAGSNTKLLKLDLHSEGEPWRSCTSLELHTRNFDEDPARAHALREAFAAASQFLNVSVVEARYEGPPRRVYHDEWCVNVFRLKAALEIYYFAMQRSEENPGQGAAPEGPEGAPTYPRLLMGSSAPRDSSSGEHYHRDVLQVNPTQILDRLRTPGSPTDNFNHPLLFALSGAAWIADGRGYDFRIGDNDDMRRAEEGRAPIASPTDTDGAVAGHRNNQIQAADSSAPPRPTTVLDNVALARRVLAIAPQLRSLSVTGIFELVVAGQHSPPVRNLHSLTIGPSPDGWTRDLDLSHPELGSVKKLRLCTKLMMGDEVKSVSGETEALSGLSHFQWSLTVAQPDVAILFSIVEGLQGVHSSVGSAETQRETQQRSISGVHCEPFAEQCDDEQGESPQCDHRRAAVNMELRMHSISVQNLLDAAPSKAISEAWRGGQDIPGKRNEVKLVPYTDWSERRFAVAQHFYDEGHQWWEAS